MQWRRIYRRFARLAGILIVLLQAQEYSRSQTRQTTQENRFDLNGEWQGQFTVNRPTLQIEKVMIQQIGEQITATKITGDEYVPAGKVTIRGAYNRANPFSAEQVCADLGYTNTRWIKASVTILDKNHLRVDGGCGQTAWERIGRPTLALDSSILFDLDKYELKSDAAAVLAKIKDQLHDLHPKSHVLVAGYTDSSGTVSHNLQLSLQRAQAVTKWLKDQGMSATLLTTKGFGKANPRYPNTNDEARARNRRVEIVVLD